MAMARGGTRALTCVGVLPLAEERTYRARDAMRFRRAVELVERPRSRRTAAREREADANGGRVAFCYLFFSRAS